MIALSVEPPSLRRSLITLGVLSVIVLACVGVGALPTAIDMPAAQALTQNYLTAISRSDPAAALQRCSHASSAHIAQEIGWWGGAEIRDLRFNAFVRMGPSYSPMRMQEVFFAYRRPGQTTWAQGFLRMFWRFPDENWWSIPSAATCLGSNGSYDP